MMLFALGILENFGYQADDHVVAAEGDDGLFPRASGMGADGAEGVCYPVAAGGCTPGGGLPRAPKGAGARWAKFNVDGVAEFGLR